MSAPYSQNKINTLREEIALQQMACQYAYHAHPKTAESYTEEAAELEKLESELEMELFNQWNSAKLKVKIGLEKMKQAVKDEFTAFSGMRTYKNSDIEARLMFFHMAQDAEAKFDAAILEHDKAVGMYEQIISQIPTEMRKSWEVGEEVES